MARDGQSDPMKYRDGLANDFAPNSYLSTRADFVGSSGTPSARNQEVMAATTALARVLRSQ